MKWDFYQYDNQPDYFVDQLWVSWQLEADKALQDKKNDARASKK